MTTERDRTTRIVLSWLREDAHENAEHVLLRALDEVDATQQRRSWWPTWRIAQMNKLLPATLAVAAVLVVAVVGYNLLPRSNTVGPPGSSPTPAPTPTAAPTAGTPSRSPASLAVGSFISHGGQIELDATGDGSNVTGSMTYTDVGGADVGRFTVDLACTRTTAGGLILIGGLVTDSTNVDEHAPEGKNVAIVLQRGSPVKAEFWFEHPDPHEPSCPAFLESVPDVGDPGRDPTGLEPIEGTIELRP